MRNAHGIFRGTLHASWFDKDTDHSYGPVYGELSPPQHRLCVRRVLEIGVLGGASIRAWCEGFSAATVTGWDLGDRPASLGRADFARTDATLVESADSLPDGRFDLIVDDGSHRLGDQAAALRWLHPKLTPDRSAW